MFVLLTSGQQEQVRARQGDQRAKRVGVSGRQAREQWCEGVNKTAVVLIRSTGALREGSGHLDLITHALFPFGLAP